MYLLAVASAASDFTHAGKQLHQGRWNHICAYTDLSPKLCKIWFNDNLSKVAFEVILSHDS